jgi:hypothetical protein
MIDNAGAAEYGGIRCYWWPSEKWGRSTHKDGRIEHQEIKA